MPALVLLLIGGAALVVLAKKGLPPHAGMPGTDLAGRFTGVSAGTDFPGGEGGGGIRSFEGSAESTSQPPAPFGVGSGFGYTPPPTSGLVGSVSLPPVTIPTSLSVAISTGREGLRSALPSPYAGIAGGITVSTGASGGGGGVYSGSSTSAQQK